MKNTESRILQVGQNAPRVDARSKVSGAEKYAADYYGDQLLWAGVKRAGVPHALIKNMELAGARSHPGILAVLTYRDLRGSNRQGVIRQDQPVLVDDKVRHCGDAVALVVAEDRAALDQALDLIAIEYDLLPGVFDMAAALEPGAVLVHEDNSTGNVLLAGDLLTGRGEAALEECAVEVEDFFEVQRQEHAYLETEGGVAILKEDGKLSIIVSTQTPFRDRAEVAKALGLDLEKIRIIAPYCGGAFGGKDGVTVQTLLSLAALHCPGRFIKMQWSREESFLASVKRHSGRLHYRLGAQADGTLHALAVEVHYDTGPYDHLGGAVLALGLEHAGGPYRIPHTRLRGWSVYTNNPIGGAFRGFGVPQVTAAMEQMMDMAAARLGLSPLEIRQRNAVRKGDRNPVGVTLTTSTGMQDCLALLADHDLWRKRETWKAAARSFKRRGVGLACVMHGMGYGPIVPDYGNANIELTEQGTFRVFSGVVDMGQGNASTYLQIVGAILNQNADQMELLQPDTDITLPSGSSSASRTTYTFGNALIGAALALKERLLQRAAALIENMAAENSVRNISDLTMAPGAIVHRKTGQTIPLSRLAGLFAAAERVSVFNFQAPVASERPTADDDMQLHGIPHHIFSYGAHLACVEVDEITGKVEVKQYLAVSDCGRIINPQVFEQQIQGGIAQGLGYALHEEFIVENGRIATSDLSTYIIPTALDIPDLQSVAVEQPEETGPFGLKGAGEIGIDGPLPAVANALADACGVRIRRYPLTAERVLQALAEKDGEGARS